MSTPTPVVAGNTCTTLVERPELAMLPPPQKGYLTEKATHALKSPRVIKLKLKDGSVVERVLLQVVVSGAIRLEERIADYLWQYKAEVSYDMVPVRTGNPPIPFLTNKDTHNPLRRHSLNPFPPGHVRGELRRPDVTIVKNPALRWPGLRTEDHQGKPHPDNILRIVELKFPGDSLKEDQREAYVQIAGDRTHRLTVADVYDCDGELERVRQPAPLPQRRAQRDLAPIRTVELIPQPVLLEQWLHEGERAVAAAWARLQAGLADLSAEAQAWLRREAPWLLQSGRWVADAAAQAYRWVNDQGQVVAQWTLGQLRAAWQEIAAQTDLAWTHLQTVDWGQLLMDVVKGIGVVVILVAGVCVALAIAWASAKILIVILAIVAQLGAAAAAAIGGVALVAAVAAG